MKVFTKILILIIASVIIFSCEKEVTVDLPRPEDRIVFEGSIENNQYASLIITRNTAYFDVVDANTLVDMVVIDTSAIITVTDGIIIDTLQLGFDFNGFIPIKYAGSKLKGEIGKTYTLNAFIEGNSYSAVTTIPQPLELDSVRFKYNNPDATEDSTGFLWLYANDPPVLGDYYKIFTKTINKDSIFVHPFNSVTDDQFFNGQPIELGVSRGYNPASGEESDQSEEDIPRWMFVKGETVVVKFCTIDAKHYDFWYSIELQNSSDGNPFAAPVTIKSNIEGGALGIWGGYGVTLDTIFIDESVIVD